MLNPVLAKVGIFTYRLLNQSAVSCVAPRIKSIIDFHHDARNSVIITEDFLRLGNINQRHGIVIFIVAAVEYSRYSERIYRRRSQAFEYRLQIALVHKTE